MGCVFNSTNVANVRYFRVYLLCKKLGLVNNACQVESGLSIASEYDIRAVLLPVIASILLR